MFSKSVKLVLQGVVRDQCTGVDYLAQCVIYKIKLGNKLDINTTGTGSPSKMDLSGQVMKRCEDSTMVDIYIIDPSESS